MGLMDIFSGGSVKAVAGVIDDSHTSEEKKLQLNK